MEENLVPIYSAANAMQAQLLREQLAERGIDAWIINEALAGGAGELPMGWATSPRVVVATHDAEKARQIAMSFDAAAIDRAKAGPAERPQYDTEPLDDEVHAWPRCPQCQHRRLAVCPYCGTAGNNFALGYNGPPVESSDPERITVACPTCDEVFAPRYYRNCEQCGHDFGDGLAVRAPKGLEPAQHVQINSRVWMLIGGTILACVVAGFYLWTLFPE